MCYNWTNDGEEVVKLHYVVEAVVAIVAGVIVHYITEAMDERARRSGSRPKHLR